MDTRIETSETILLAGMGFYGDPFGKASAWDEENEIGALWKRFMALLSGAPGSLPAASQRSGRWYELHVMGSEAALNGRYEVFVGARVQASDLPALPVELSAKALPAREYAVLTLRGAEISSDWMARLYGEIVPSLGRKADASYSFQLYDSRFKGMDRIAESELEAWIPLEAESGN